jgi:hypothetical protein
LSTLKFFDPARHVIRETKIIRCLMVLGNLIRPECSMINSDRRYVLERLSSPEKLASQFTRFNRPIDCGPKPEEYVLVEATIPPVVHVDP